MRLTKSERQTRDSFRLIGALILGIFWIFLQIGRGLLWLVGVRSMEIETASKFVRQGSGGRFHSVPIGDLRAAFQPVQTAIDRAAALKRHAEIMPPDEAHRFLGNVRAVADEIDRACDRFQAQNYSFAHKRAVQAFNLAIDEARKIARDLREKTTVTDMQGKTVSD